MIDRRGLLKTAVAVYGVLTAIAVGLAWVAGVGLARQLEPEAAGLLLGVAAVVPMSVVFFIAPDLKDQVVDLLGPALSACRIHELAFLALLAGVAEELLFRGALEGWLRQYDVVLAVVITNLVFGAMHPMTPLYFVIAAVLGGYLSLLAAWSPERNLTAPIVAHGVYDFVAFLIVRHDFRSRGRGPAPLPVESPASGPLQNPVPEPPIEESPRS